MFSFCTYANITLYQFIIDLWVIGNGKVGGKQVVIPEDREEIDRKMGSIGPASFPKTTFSEQVWGRNLKVFILIWANFRKKKEKWKKSVKNNFGFTKSEYF